MDSMIPIGLKNTLAEYMILSGADNRPPMLDKDLYDFWKSRMELYMQNREHRRMILESVEHGPLIWPKIEENGVTRTKKYAELSATEKTQSLPRDLWERISTTNASKLVDDGQDLVKDLHTTNFDQLHAYLQQHELYANEVRIMHERNHDPLALVANHQQTSSHFNTYQSSYNNPQFQQQFSSSSSPQYGSINQQTYLAKFPQIDSGLAVTVFKQGDDPTDAINKMMSFLSTIVTSRFPSTKNQLRNSSNPRQQATIHDGRVSVQSVQGRQTSFATGMSGTRANISGTEGNNSGQQRAVKCFNCQWECHMARQCPKPKRKRDATWFRDKVLLVEAQVNGKILNEEEFEFLADPGIAEGPVTQTVITHNVAYNADDLDAYDSDCDDFSTAKAILISRFELVTDQMSRRAVQDTNSFPQQDAMILSAFEQLSNQVTNCNKVNKDNLIANESLSTELERYKERVKLLKERQNVDLSTQEKLLLDDIIQEKENKNIDKEIALEKKVKELDNIVYKMGQSAQTVHMLTKPQVFYDNNLKQALGFFQNHFYLKKAQQIRPPMLLLW
ncbi:retrovirus-related pol polyprotein from transposon TNT 1-94 [Tanacetum coccineum]